MYKSLNAAVNKCINCSLDQDNS